MVENMDAAVNTGVTDAANSSVLETIKQNVNPQAIVQKLKLSQAQLIDIGLYGAIGFLLGFFIKHYATYVIAFAIFITGIILLSQFNMISLQINWSRVYQTLNIPATTSIGVDNIAVIAWEWTRSNVFSASSFSIGLLVGLKVG